MKLLTKALETALLKAGVENMRPIVKFFTPDAQCTWLITAMEDNKEILWGYADLGFGCVEFGTISFSELKALRGGLGLPIERDFSFKDKPEINWLDRETLAGC